MDEGLVRVEEALGIRVVSAVPVRGRGYTPNKRWVIASSDDSTAFVKAAVDEGTAARLRREHAILSQLDAPFTPRIVGWIDDGESPILVLEDLSRAVWPPPWSAQRVEMVVRGLERVAATPMRDRAPPLEDLRAELAGWTRVSIDPESFLRLGLCSASWLERSLPNLLAATETADLSGHGFLHLDVRSDNICFVDEHVVLIDWDTACVGRAEFDVAFWLPSLHAEGGPTPEDVLPRASPDVVALVSGYFASKAGLPRIPNAPRVRDVQLKQLRIALPWAARVLALPPPDPSSS